MNLKILTVPTALLLISHGLQAQTVTFLDQTTRTPIPDVTLTCTGQATVVVSKADGHVDIAALKGCDNIRIDHLSYTPANMAWAALAASPELSLTYRMNLLREVVTSGSRFTEPKRDVPEQIDVLGKQELIKIVVF